MVFFSQTLLAATAIMGSWLWAGGPFAVFGGDPLVWEDPDLEYFLEGGPEAPGQAVLDVFEAANQSWNEIEDSQANLGNPRMLTEDIDADDFIEALDTGRRQNLMVIDEDGSLLDAVFGEGASNSIAGVTVAIGELSNGSPIYRASHIVFNGDLIGSPLFPTVVRHELGHFLGLDHTQVGLFEAFNLDGSDNSEVPVMFPFIIPGASEQLKADDRSWLIRLYPSESVSAGTITGRVFDTEDEPVSAVNVVAVPSGNTEPVARVAVSSVSDYRDQGDGFFALPGLPPGEYLVFIESLDPFFQAGNGIGPFTPPFPVIIPEFYNGDDESSSLSDNPLDRTPVEVSAGIPTFGIDFFLQNRAPFVEAGDHLNVFSESLVDLRPVQAGDPDGTDLDFEWTQLQGLEVMLMDADERIASFTAPEVAATVLLLFQVRVADGELEATDTLLVAVRPLAGPNALPVVNAGDDQMAGQGDEVLLQGSAQDEDGDELILTWTQLSGPDVELNNASALNPSFMVPDDLEPAELVFRLQADDSRGGVDEDEVSVQVIGNGPPAVSAAAGQTQVKPLVEVTLTADAADPDGDELAFLWEQTGGPGVELANADSAETSFVSPNFDFEADLTFVVTVSDGEATAQDLVAVTVIPFERTIFLASLLATEPLTEKVSPSSLVLSPPVAFDAFVGTAVLNTGGTATALRFDLLDVNGSPVASNQPAELLQPGAQFARLSGELIEGSDDGGPSTIEARGLQSDIRGFFLIGDFDLQRQDGIGASPASEEMFFDIARLDNTTSTLVHLYNPGLAPAELTARLFSPEGEMLREQDLVLPSKGNEFSRLDFLFRNVFSVEEGYVQVTADQPLQGSALLITETSFAALRGQSMETTQALRSPQFFSDPQGGGSTELRLLSLEDGPVVGALRAFDNQGQELANAPLQVEAGQLLIVDAAQALGLQGDELIVGHLSIEFAEPVLVQGAVSFTSNQDTTRSILPLLRTPVLETLFLQVAQSAELGIFTGLALLSASDVPATVTVRAFNAQGQESGQAEVQLQPGQRVVDLLGSNTFFGADFSQNGGHFRVSSDQPIFAFALFGDFAGNFLASIEGQTP